MKKLRPKEKRRAFFAIILFILLIFFLKFCGKEEIVNNDLQRIANSVIKISEEEVVEEEPVGGSEEKFLEEETASVGNYSYVEDFDEIAVPVSGRISSLFGYRKDPFGNETELHSGIDIAVPQNTEIAAFSGGVVIAAKWSDIGGYYVKIEHPNGFISYYGHLSKILVKENEEVSAGQIIALSGATGKVTGAHLHFQLSYENRVVDPSLFVDFTP